MWNRKGLRHKGGLAKKDRQVLLKDKRVAERKFGEQRSRGAEEAEEAEELKGREKGLSVTLMTITM